MRARSVAVVVVMVLTGSLAVAVGPAAHAATGTPLDCPGVVATNIGYRLTQDVECVFGEWTEDNKVLDLAGHTFAGRIYPFGDGQTLRNGTLVTTVDYWAGASDFTVSHVTVQPPTPGGCLDFCIEAGDITIEHSTFQDIGGIALDFFFGSSGSTIRYTDFLRNGIGISIQGDSDLTIEKNRFIGNGTGLNLFTEDAFGVNDNTIRSNLFRQNQWGLRMNADDVDPWDSRILSGNRVDDNRFAQNRGSGVLVEVHCYSDFTDECDLPTDNFVVVNHFWQNGSDPADPFPFADDGLTARGYDDGDGSTSTDLPEALAGFQLARNRAHHSADLGFDVAGVTDWRGNRAWSNGNTTQCAGIACQHNAGPLAGIGGGSAGVGAAVTESPLTQLEHDTED